MLDRSGEYLVEARPDSNRREAERSVRYPEKCYEPERGCGASDLTTYDATQMATRLRLRGPVAIPKAADAPDTASGRS